MSTEPTSTENLDRIWKAAESIRVAMLVTRDASGLISRPMSAIVRRDESAIWFLTDATSGKLDDIAAHPEVSVSFCDSSSLNVAFRGTASVHSDRKTIDDLWSKPAQAFYPNGPGDPIIRAVRVSPEHAELWDGPGTVVAMVRIAAALVSGTSVHDMGDHVESAV